jgi:hypothetical protein
MDRKPNGGIWVVWLFATPFALFGVAAVIFAFTQLIRGAGAMSFWFPLIIGTLFGSIGFGLIAMMVTQGKRGALRQQLQAEHPNEPWLWREDWAQGRIRSKTRTSMVREWVFTIFWNLAILPTIWLAVPRALSQRSFAALIVLVFPAAGLYLLLRSLRRTVAYLKYGTSYFQMPKVPGSLGGELQGTIEAPFPHSPDHGVQLRLLSIHRVTEGYGKTRSRDEWILWSNEVKLGPGMLCAGPTGTTIPVSIPIPPDAHPTEEMSPAEEYAWLLEATADMPGINYREIFEIPVFRTADSPAPAEAAAQNVTVRRTVLRAFQE